MTSTLPPSLPPSLPLLRRAEALVGLPYVDGTFDCGHLVVRAAAELWGRTVHLPLQHPHPVQASQQAAALRVCRRELAHQVEQPEPGDLALMTECVDNVRGWHLATVVATVPELWVLHTRAGGCSLLQRMADCRRQGLALEGWYRWI